MSSRLSEKTFLHINSLLLVTVQWPWHTFKKIPFQKEWNLRNVTNFSTENEELKSCGKGSIWVIIETASQLKFVRRTNLPVSKKYFSCQNSELAASKLVDNLKLSCSVMFVAHPNIVYLHYTNVNNKSIWFYMWRIFSNELLTCSYINFLWSILNIIGLNTSPMRKIQLC